MVAMLGITLFFCLLVFYPTSTLGQAEIYGYCNGNATSCKECVGVNDQVFLFCSSIRYKIIIITYC